MYVPTHKHKVHIPTVIQDDISLSFFFIGFFRKVRLSSAVLSERILQSKQNVWIYMKRGHYIILKFHCISQQCYLYRLACNIVSRNQTVKCNRLTHKSSCYCHYMKWVWLLIAFVVHITIKAICCCCLPIKVHVVHI